VRHELIHPLVQPLRGVHRPCMPTAKSPPESREKDAEWSEHHHASDCEPGADDGQRHDERRKLSQCSNHPQHAVADATLELTDAHGNPRRGPPAKNRATVKEAVGELVPLGARDLLRQARLNCRYQRGSHPLDEGRRESDKSQSRRSHLGLPR
jgi:hypothetical protein